MSTNWLNDDGLYIKFGTNEATPAIVGEHRHDGAFHEIELDLDLTTLTDAAAIINDTVKLPDGAQLYEVELLVTEAATGTDPTLRVGQIDEDRTSAGDDDSIITDETESNMGTVGNRILYTQGSTNHGVLVGTILTKSLYITASYETDPFTAGAVKIFLRYHMTE